jgi:hypothetical protein
MQSEMSIIAVNQYGRCGSSSHMLGRSEYTEYGLVEQHGVLFLGTLKYEEKILFRACPKILGGSSSVGQPKPG